MTAAKKRGRPVGSGKNERAAEICRLYKEGATQSMLARQFGVSRQRIQQIMRSAGVPGRPLYDVLSREELYRVYVAERRSLSQTAKILGTSMDNVRRHLGFFDIELRLTNLIQIDREVLERLYLTDGLTQRQTARNLGIGVPAVRRELRRHGITFRHKRKPRIG